jgi:hypothetical protein
LLLLLVVVVVVVALVLQRQHQLPMLQFFAAIVFELHGSSTTGSSSSW